MEFGSSSSLGNVPLEIFDQVLSYLVTPSQDNVLIDRTWSDKLSWTAKHVFHPEVFRLNQEIHGLAKDVMKRERWFIIEVDEPYVTRYWERVKRHTGFYGTPTMIVLDSELCTGYVLPETMAHIKIKYHVLNEQWHAITRRQSTILVSERNFADVMRFLRMIDLAETLRQDGPVNPVQKALGLQLVANIDPKITDKSLKIVLSAIEKFKGPLHEISIAGGPPEAQDRARAVEVSAALAQPWHNYTVWELLGHSIWLKQQVDHMLHPTELHMTSDALRAWQPLAMAVNVPFECLTTDTTPWLGAVFDDFKSDPFYRIVIGVNTFNALLLDFTTGTRLMKELLWPSGQADLLEAIRDRASDEPQADTEKLRYYQSFLNELRLLRNIVPDDPIEYMMESASYLADSMISAWSVFEESEPDLNDPTVLAMHDCADRASVLMYFIRECQGLPEERDDLWKRINDMTWSFIARFLPVKLIVPKTIIPQPILDQGLLPKWEQDDPSNRSWCVVGGWWCMEAPPTDEYYLL